MSQLIFPIYLDVYEQGQYRSYRYRQPIPLDGLQIDQRFLCSLCWDEMLGALARFCLSWDRHSIPENVYPVREEGLPSYTLEIDRNDNLYSIVHEESGRFISELTFDEMLAFVARYTLDGTECFSGLRTYEQWRESRRSFSKMMGKDKPVALLTER